jgi:RNA polymerase sporulation-specific sigma factor
MGLIKAADGFDEKRGLKFSTYAVPVILGEIRRLFRDGGAVKVSRSLKEMSMRASREREDFISREGREPTVSEMADLLGVGIEQAAEALSAAMPALSLTKAGEDEGEQLDVPVEPPDELLTDKLALQQVLCELDSLDRALIVLRYLKSNTQQATAEKLGMTQVQVSRRERAILEIMRRKLTG